MARGGGGGRREWQDEEEEQEEEEEEEEEENGKMRRKRRRRKRRKTSRTETKQVTQAPRHSHPGRPVVLVVIASVQVGIPDTVVATGMK